MWLDLCPVFTAIVSMWLLYRVHQWALPRYPSEGQLQACLLPGQVSTFMSEVTQTDNQHFSLGAVSSVFWVIIQLGYRWALAEPPETDASLQDDLKTSLCHWQIQGLFQLCPGGLATAAYFWITSADVSGTWSDLEIILYSFITLKQLWSMETVGSKVV